MANFAGNLSFRISSHLQYRVFFIPWVKKNSVTAITCLKSRDYGSSVPLRFIPKNSSKTNKSENSPPMKGLEKNEFHNRSDAMQRSIVFDKEKSQNRNQMFQNNASFDGAKQELEDEILHYEEMEEAKEAVEKLTIHQGKDCEWDILHAGKAKLDAEKLAIALLATRAFTAVELRKKLHGKGFSADTVEAVINDLQSRGFINDNLYAEIFSRSRWSTSSWGPRRIKQALYKKGVSEVDAEKAVKLVFEEGESGDQESSIGLSRLSMDQLFVQASKQWLRGRDVPKETRKSRIIRWLQYRGFNWGVVSVILKKLESQYPS